MSSNWKRPWRLVGWAVAVFALIVAVAFALGGVNGLALSLGTAWIVVVSVGVTVATWFYWDKAAFESWSDRVAVLALWALALALFAVPGLLAGLFGMVG